MIKSTLPKRLLGQATFSLYTDLVLFFFSIFSKTYYPLALEVNKSPAVYIFSNALNGLGRENTGSVNRLGNLTLITFILRG